MAIAGDEEMCDQGIPIDLSRVPIRPGPLDCARDDRFFGIGEG